MVTTTNWAMWWCISSLVTYFCCHTSSILVTKSDLLLYRLCYFPDCNFKTKCEFTGAVLIAGYTFTLMTQPVWSSCDSHRFFICLYFYWIVKVLLMLNYCRLYSLLYFLTFCRKRDNLFPYVLVSFTVYVFCRFACIIVLKLKYIVYLNI